MSSHVLQIFLHFHFIVIYRKIKKHRKIQNIITYILCIILWKILHFLQYIVPYIRKLYSKSKTNNAFFIHTIIEKHKIK